VTAKEGGEPLKEKPVKRRRQEDHGVRRALQTGVNIRGYDVIDRVIDRFQSA
jgi:hypothetical protein